MVYPSSTLLTLDQSLTNSLANAGRYVYLMAMRHKIKTGVLIACLMGTYKTYGFYRTFREMTGGLPSEAPKKESNPSQQAIQQFLTQTNPKHGQLQIRVF